MNTYSENLQQTVSDTLMALTDQQTKIVSAQVAAQYSLYYAQGTEITAIDKLATTESQAHYYQKVNDQGVINDNQAINILASATHANSSVVSTVSNISTAAANVQIASNAIALLASDIGAALNIATASLFGTDSYKKINEANSFINEVANDAKNASLASMDASSYTSEIIAGSVLAQATTVKAKIDNLLKVTQSEFNSLAALEITENQTLWATKNAERKAEGVLKDADSDVIAITNAYNKANNQLNLGLSVSVQSGTRISVSFNALSNPFPTFQSPLATAITVPSITVPTSPATYYLAIVPADKQTLFSLDQAEQLFAQKNSAQFIPVSAPANLFPIDFSKGTDGSYKNKDVYNEPVKAGKAYVAYLYIELNNDYKRYIGNFSDILSAASQPFVPATPLPLAQKIISDTPTTNPTAPVAQISFITSNYDHSDINVQLKFCCIFVEINKLKPLSLMHSDDPLTSNIPIYFNIGLAEQVSPANYYTQLTPTTDGTSCCCHGGTVVITIPSDVTDNFGNPIIPGEIYQPYILTLVNDPSKIGQYTSVLSNQLDSVVLIPATPQNKLSEITPAPAANNQ